MPWTNAQLQDFASMLLLMGELFETPVSSARAELFTRALEDLPFGAVRAAANTYLRTGRFFPKPVDLRELVMGDGEVEGAAELAWQFVLREVRRVGWTGTPVWPDAATERAALGLFGGGWRTLCECLPGQGPELLGYRKAFVASYSAAARQAAVGALPIGREEAGGLLGGLKRALAARGLPSGKL